MASALESSYWLIHVAVSSITIGQSSSMIVNFTDVKSKPSPPGPTLSPVKLTVISAFPSLELLSIGVTVIVASYELGAKTIFPSDGLTVNRELSPVTLNSNV